jgi:transcriptional regulator with XRE-family HTH domain
VSKSSQADAVPLLPIRLRELRLEAGWSLRDVMDKTGVSQRAVVSNWEATNQRRRTPELATLLILSRWYGASIDYMIGNRGAKRDSAVVADGKAALKERLQSVKNLGLTTPSERARLAFQQALAVAPDAFFLERASLYVGLTAGELQALLQEGSWPDAALQALAQFLGINVEWFFAPTPDQVLNGVS